MQPHAMQLDLCVFVHYFCMFMFYERSEIVNMQKDIMIEKALETLKAETGIEGRWNAGDQADGTVDIIFKNKTMLFLLEAKSEIRNHNLGQLYEFAATHKKSVMVIAEKIYPKIKAQLRDQGIAYLTTTGDTYIEKAPLLIWIEKAKKDVDFFAPKAKAVNRAFTKTGLKVVFLFLQNELFVNRPYRDIAEEAGVALGNINYIINGLKEFKFLLQKNKDQFILQNRKELLEKWMTAYEERLKPDLFIGNFRFLQQPLRSQWQNFTFENEKTCWGGEAAGELLTDFLRAQILTIYTEEPRQELMSRYRLVPDEKGDIKVYRKFWKTQDHQIAHYAQKTFLAPHVLVYADLVNTGDKRCINTAQRIYDQFLESKLE
jgi:hypothetical protein